jgi:XPB/Ssl2-like helicase family protein
VSDLVWRLEAPKILAAVEDGRSVDEIREFLAARSGAPLPDPVRRLLEDVADRCARVHDRGLARLVECAEPALAALIATDIRTRAHCMRTGDHHLVVPAASEAAFRRSLRELGFLLAPGHVRVTRSERTSTSDKPGPRQPKDRQVALTVDRPLIA